MSSNFDLHPMTRRSLLSGIAATSALVLLHPFSARAAANQAHLRLMETTDIHVNVFPYDYYADKPNDTMGLARTATIIEGIRAEAGNSLLIDNGDVLQGNPMGDYMAYQHGMKDGDVHPVIKAMNTLGYEVGTLGNHEFNYGLDFMFKVLAGANFPFVCANLTKGQLASDPKSDDLFFKPYVIVEKQIKDGAGATARSRSASSASCRRRSCCGTSRTSTARRRPATSSRRPRPGCPSHEGGRRRYRHRALPFRHRRQRDRVRAHGKRLAASRRRRRHRRDLHRPPASGLPRSEELGRHRRCRSGEGHAAGKPAVMAGFWGSHLGLIDLLLEKDGNELEDRRFHRRKPGRSTTAMTRRRSSPSRRQAGSDRRRQGRA